MPGIATYNAKRDFRLTPEPRGGGAKRASGQALQYVIQKHDASHLHYDFRLEIGGVLVSWAIPKGPSLDPKVKRLAVRTEDHPMAYGSFEGVIPEGQYGGGTVMLWDRGTWEPIGSAVAGLKNGSLKFKLHGQRLQGEFALARMKARNGEKRENWLLIKHNDTTAMPGSDAAVIEDNTDSVASKRAMSAIAADKSKSWQSPDAKKGAKPQSNPRPAGRPPETQVATRKKRIVKPQDPAKIAGSRKAAMPAKMAPQLATLVEEAPEQSGWLSEIKFDGYRMLARLENGKVKLTSRNGLPWNAKVPAIVAALEKIDARQAWLDGELIATNEHGKSDFGRLKEALSHKPPTGLQLYLFDITYLNGYDLSACRQDERKAVLEALLGQDPPASIKYSEHFEGVPDRVREHACALGLEGIICKRADAPYRQRRNRNWLKLKCIQREEFVIIGFTEPQGSRSGFGSLHVGYYDKKGALHYAGGVGTGFSEATLKSLHTELLKLERHIGPRLVVHGEGPPKAMRWVAPKLVVETQYLEMTPDKILRHAVFMGLREDKAAGDVIREPPSDSSPRVVAANTTIRAPAPKTTGTLKRASSRPAVPAIIDNRKATDHSALTHPERVLWPREGLTKADLAAYWRTVADLALPHIAGRALALVRCPDGIAAEHFFQKKVSPGFPRAIDDLRSGKDRVMAIHNAEGLQALSQMSAIELHPWGSRIDDAERPDRLIFDLDPDAGLEFSEVVGAAHTVKDALQEGGLQSFCKTTGGKGLHVVVPLRPALGWQEAKAFSAAVAQTMAAAEPKRFLATASKAARRDRIFIDYLRNGRGATAIAPFSPRARPGAAISMPLEWRDVTAKLDPQRYTIAKPAEIAKLAATRWNGFFDVDQQIGGKARLSFGLK